ncbi:ubiquinone/menaquinone biosynthesis methyltransferase [bacterium]|nr:ubiquinone/menaquinone biosynthesis methyltransferase [bacterium]
MSEAVREMFASIAPRYDLANSIISLGQLQRWRKRLAALSGVVAGGSVLDCATGTGDLALALKRRVGPGGTVIGVDYCPEMLALASAKAARQGLALRLERADVMQLPYEPGRFDAATIAFGMRNLDDAEKGLCEMARVVRPGGRLLVLETGLPASFLQRALFHFCGRHIVPLLGGIITGNIGAFRYLYQTATAFPSGEAFLAIMRRVDSLTNLQARPLAGGVAYIYTAEIGQPQYGYPATR